MLSENPDRRKTYYKITNGEENHHGLQYHDGLVIDSVPFNSNSAASCVKGGIYFSTKEYIHMFFEYGCWIRPVKIPEDAKVVVNPGGDKYRADKLFFEPREDFGWYFDNLFDRKTFPKNNYWRLAKCCSNYFNKWFDKRVFPEYSYWTLAQFCPDHFDEWFDKNTFPEKEYWRLAAYCPSHFDRWFDKKTFPIGNYWALAAYCLQHFDKWFDKETFPNSEYWALIAYCQKYRSKWKR